MKRALLTVVLLALLVPTGARAAGQTIFIRNTSTVMSDQQIENALPALQAQVDLDFAPVWSMDATLRFIGSAEAPADAWTLTVNDVSDVMMALGYHTVCNQNGHGAPCAYVSAQSTLDAGEQPTVTLDHELLEMLADPFTTTMQKVGRRYYIQEVCDAPEEDAYTRPGADGSPVMLSDFVTPAWFRPGHVGPYDHLGRITQPLQLLPGGYISWIGPDGKWHQKFARGARTSAPKSVF